MRPSLQLETIEARLANQTVTTQEIVPGQREAAVALVLQPKVSGLRALFILRAKKEGDPWSGQMALPGGHRETIDADLVETARRETHEEIGLDLNQAGRYLGSLAGIRANPRAGFDLVVTPQVFALEDKAVPLQPNEEVAEVLWGNLDEMISGRSLTDASFPEFQREGTFPGYQVGAQVVWGLTFRMINDFFDLIRPGPG
ncbi:CoA pyrophosphatase [Pseudomonadales bacterium]|jgi:8-oxo-dGTP pyrophosphatase MutT (NUDIX family)|nr:CoA pyrophosphatase [Pseudomonadales bacterium]MDA8627512.1 CoA pyrophosphatase [Pseudomonadales bacterium]MDA8949282.1 CoA pyrophosphatase [Pseudomonadales bacterium]MDB9876010.1 CoA pyrophosphatase [Pseudomonadales bacterium]MDC1238642.1 CoA pyrophosphatase [Pseudomonadales bacterium]